jgi:hypothetical protein
LGAADIVKSTLASTVSVTLAVWLVDPLVPVIVIFVFPTGIPDGVVIVKIEVPALMIPVGLNEALALTGSPLAARDTTPPKPLKAPTEILKLVLVPGGTIRELCNEEIEKSPGAAVIVATYVVTATGATPCAAAPPSDQLENK